MATFYKSTNNGVIAVISKEDAEVFWISRSAGRDPIEEGVRIFTFCPLERLKEDPISDVFAGSVKNLKDIIKAGNHRLIDFSLQGGMAGWDGYVPFSRLDYPESDLKYATSFADVRRVFGESIFKIAAGR